MAQTVTPPPLQGPTAKEKKYDRQLRLWAASGQKALEACHILLLNGGSGVVGIETLKNLVLPGIGRFTIVDERLVGEEDLGVNFFLEESSLGKSRAEECCRLLRELNPEVQGHARKQSVEDFLEDTNLADYTLVLLIGPSRIQTLKKISNTAWELNIPLFYVHSIGFYSTFSIQLPEHFPIVDTHTDPVSTQDLRLLRPWPELTKFAEKHTTNLEYMDNHEHGHVPYLLLLLHYLERWRKDHDGKPPESYKEKVAFREMVRAGARTDNPEGGEENFDEAVGAVLKSLNPPSIPSGFKDIVVLPECRAPSRKTADFWLIANAVHWFVCKHDNLLPLPGALPDMKAQSKDYVALQALYRSKAQADLKEVLNSLRSKIEERQYKNVIDDKEVEAFCKGAAFVKLLYGRMILLPAACDDFNPVEDERSGKLKAKAEEENKENEEPIPEFQPSLLAALVAFRAFDAVIDQDHDAVYPRNEESTAKLETALVHEIRKMVAPERQDPTKAEAEASSHLGPFEQRAIDVAKELTRSGGGEMHNISALTGGAVAQEVIKVVTKQYIPVDNTCVFDGIKSRSETFRI